MFIKISSNATNFDGGLIIELSDDQSFSYGGGYTRFPNKPMSLEYGLQTDNTRMLRIFENHVKPENWLKHDEYDHILMSLNTYPEIMSLLKVSRHITWFKYDKVIYLKDAVKSPLSNEEWECVAESAGKGEINI